MPQPNWVQEHIELYRKNPEEGHLWDLMVEIWPSYVDYQRKTEREIPVVFLQPLGTN